MGDLGRTKINKVHKTFVILCLFLVASCSFFHIGGRYAPTKYDGIWRTEFESEQCGNYLLEHSINGGSIGIHAYGDIYSFSGRVSKSSMHGAGVEKEELRSAQSNEIVFVIERPAFEIKFTSSGTAHGTWQAKNCNGTIEMKKITDF